MTYGKVSHGGGENTRERNKGEKKGGERMEGGGGIGFFTG